MLTIQYFLPSSSGEAGLPPAPLYPAGLPARRRRLRLYLVGSEADTRSAIDSLHVLGYAERIEWSRTIAIPQNGLVVRPDAGDVLRYLQRAQRPEL